MVRRRAICRLAVAFMLAALAPATITAGGNTESLTVQTATAKHTFAVELAITSEQQARGLMFRRQLAPNAGMLFVYDSAVPVAMWMKNTFIPLDMLFIAADGRVMHIVERTVPHSTELISSRERVRAVLEINGGTVNRLGIKVGDRVIHPVFQ